MKGASSTAHGSKILCSFLDLEGTFRTRAWSARVPTSANPTDPPSRGIFDHLLSQGVSQVRVNFEYPVLRSA